MFLFFSQRLCVTADPKNGTVRNTPQKENTLMNTNRRTLALVIASFCGTSSVSMAQDGATLMSIVEPTSHVDSAVVATRFNPAADLNSLSTSGSLSDSSEVIDSSTSLDRSNANVTSPEESKVPAAMASYGGSQTVCDSGCTHSPSTSCYTASCSPSKALSRSDLGWFEMDTLLWWGRGLTDSPVIVGGANPTVLPTIPLLGGRDNPIGNDLLLGLRTDVGLWLDDCSNYGFGGRTWGILTDGSEQVIVNGGNSTGIQFFNTSIGAPDSYVVNLDRGVFGANVGEIGVLSDLDVFSGELYGRGLLVGDRRNRVDLIGGYTFLRLDSGYQLRSRIVDGFTDSPPPVGTITTIVDQFSTKNTFHGGSIGLASNLTRGRVGVGLTGKVALGNMESTSIVSGTFSQVPPSPNPPTFANRGLFAQSSNIGTITQNNFTFIPEMNAKLRYRIGRGELGVGYTIVVLPEVAMAPSQIDQNIDVLNILGAPVAPAPNFNTEAYFLHGLDLGMTFRF